MDTYEIHTGQTEWPCLVAVALNDVDARPTGNGFEAKLKPEEVEDLRQALSIACPDAKVLPKKGQGL